MREGWVSGCTFSVCRLLLREGVAGRGRQLRTLQHLAIGLCRITEVVWFGFVTTRVKYEALWLGVLAWVVSRAGAPWLHLLLFFSFSQTLIESCHFLSAIWLSLQGLPSARQISSEA